VPAFRRRRGRSSTADHGHRPGEPGIPPGGGDFGAVSWWVNAACPLAPPSATWLRRASSAQILSTSSIAGPGIGAGIAGIQPVHIVSSTAHRGRSPRATSAESVVVVREAHSSVPRVGRFRLTIGHRPPAQAAASMGRQRRLIGGAGGQITRSAAPGPQGPVACRKQPRRAPSAGPGQWLRRAL